MKPGMNLKSVLAATLFAVVMFLVLLGLIAGCATPKQSTQIYYEGNKALVITMGADTSWTVYELKDSVKWIR